MDEVREEREATAGKWKTQLDAIEVARQRHMAWQQLRREEAEGATAPEDEGDEGDKDDEAEDKEDRERNLMLEATDTDEDAMNSVRRRSFVRGLRSL